MAKQEIIIDVFPNGDVRVEGVGFVGAECTKLTKAIEEAVGVVVKQELKPEYRQSNATGRKVGA